MDSDSESEDLLLDDEGVFDDFTVASSWERLISEIEATCRKWQTNLAEDCLVCGAEVCDGYGRLHKVHCDLNYGNKSYRLDFYFEVDKQGTADDWLMDCHHLQVSFGVQDFLVLAPVSMSGVILDAPEATLLLSAVSVALSNCGSIWPAFVPVHDPTRKAYRGIQGMRGPYCRSFEADRIGSQVPVKLMHLEGLYDLFISKLAFCSPDSAAEYDGKVSFSVRLTYHTPMPGFEISSAEDALTPTAKAVEGFDGDTSFKRQWDEECPWAEWYTVDDPIKGFELIATWANRIAESSLDMAEFENISVFEADKWLLAPIMTQVSEPLMESSNVSFAYRMRKLFEAFSISKEAKFMGDFCTGDSLIMKRITSSTMVPPTSVLDRVLKSLLPEGEVVSTLFEGRRNHQIAQDVKGAPTNSLFAQFCLHAMWFGDCNICAISVLWIEFVREMRWYWEELQSFPRMPRGGKPDFKSCLVHQKLQLLAACIERKAEEQHQHTQAVTMKRLNNDNTGWQGGADPSLPAEGTFEEGNNLESQEGSLMLLRTRDRMRLPTTQKQPLMTEDMLLEREHALVVLGDSPSGKMTRAKLQASMLSSDMSAFKAANPRASFEDFIRWHSPRDWVENDVFQDSLESLSPSSSSNNFENLSWPPKGRLSDRMAHPDNSWIQLWESVDPVPADKQKPLFDHTREGEKSTIGRL
ncbi:hypothetical protein KP509_31G003200 [Ceratopteris richardii]|uniref:Rab3 GTPase-activating protein catalytic subunit n=1 Tax=Ceratopteris richardii TaxID=49495 RepID=A0A8T2QUY2_CERRI|nr:hypothetical protein KP509_31G003200 [Ceratopteris richardii]